MTAELLGPLRAPVHRFVLGKTEITSILDGSIPMGISPPFLLNESDDEISEIARAANLPTDRLENNFVPVLVNTGQVLERRGAPAGDPISDRRRALSGERPGLHR